MKKLIKWIVVILWMTIIFFLSNEKGSDSLNESNTLLLIISNIIKVDLNTPFWIFVIRKLAHFVEFGILAILVLSLIKEYKDITFNDYIYTLIFVLVYSISDEFHQLFVENRGPSIKDVLIDTSGGIIFLLLKGLKRN